MESTLKFVLRKECNKRDNKRLMREGYILGNINRRNAPSIAIAVLKSDFKLFLKGQQRKEVVKLEGPDGMIYDVKLRDIQIRDIIFELHHVDFQAI